MLPADDVQALVVAARLWWRIAVDALCSSSRDAALARVVEINERVMRVGHG